MSRVLVDCCSHAGRYVVTFDCAAAKEQKLVGTTAATTAAPKEVLKIEVQLDSLSENTVRGKVIVSNL